MRAATVVHDLTITAEGYELLWSELEALRTDGRREMSERLREARADAPIDDNPALFEAFQDQAQLERRIATLESHLSTARIAEPARDGSAAIGSLLRLRDLETGEHLEYRLVGAIEANASAGRVSVDAPVGRALVGATPGEVVNVRCPNATLRFEVLSVEPGEPRKKAA